MGYLLLIWSMIVAGWVQTPAPQDVAAILANAEKLYYDANFEGAISVLTPLDTALESQAASPAERISVKVLLALAYIGRNEHGRAKSFFKEVSALDPQFLLPPEKFSSNVMALFDEAKEEHREGTCRQICERANRSLDVQNTAEVLQLLETSDDTCGGL
jgi:hypothetical protein